MRSSPFFERSEKRASILSLIFFKSFFLFSSPSLSLFLDGWFSAHVMSVAPAPYYVLCAGRCISWQRIQPFVACRDLRLLLLCLGEGLRRLFTYPYSYPFPFPHFLLPLLSLFLSLSDTLLSEGTGPRGSFSKEAQ